VQLKISHNTPKLQSFNFLSEIHFQQTFNRSSGLLNEQEYTDVYEVKHDIDVHHEDREMYKGWVLNSLALWQRLGVLAVLQVFI